MSTYSKSLFISVEFGELQYTEVRTAALSTPTNICSSLWHCIRAGCGSSKPRDAAGPGGAHLGRVRDKLLCLHTRFRPEHTRVHRHSCLSLSCLNGRYVICELSPNWTPSLWYHPAVRCKLQLLMLKSGVGVPSKVQNRIQVEDWKVET